MRTSSALSGSLGYIEKSPRGQLKLENDYRNSQVFTPTKKIPRTPEAISKQEKSLAISLRVRPLKDGERQGCIEVDGDTIKLIPPSTTLNGRGQSKLFDFQKVFGPECGQEEVFMGSVYPLLGSLSEGRDLLFFAYGVTGAGKTFTVEGVPQERGLIYRTLSSILNSMRTGSPYNMKQYSELSVSVFEIFNEKIYDLLIPSTKISKKTKEPKAALSLGRGSDGRTIVDGASEFFIEDESEITDLIERANTERHKAETTFNHSSSRSHVVFRLTIRPPEGAPLYASIVDLAGCERTKTMGDERMRESCNINKSMLVLGRCIRNLSQRQQAVPYRESLITRLFKDFFESPGRCAVAGVMVNITPSADQYDDTSFSLGFAVDAGNCVTTTTNVEEPVANNTSVMSTDVIMAVQKYINTVESSYQQQVTSLMERTRYTKALHQKIDNSVPMQDYVSLQKENEELREKLRQANERISKLELMAPF